MTTWIYFDGDKTSKSLWRANMCMHSFNTCYDPAESTCILLVDRSMTSPSIEIREALYSNFGISIKSYIIELPYVSAKWHFLDIDFIN